MVWAIITILTLAGVFAEEAAPSPPPPPGRGFQLQCSDIFCYSDATDPALLQEFAQNDPPGYQVVSVDPCIYPGKNSHRYIVMYRSRNFRRCEDIKRALHDMNTYKPQNSNVGVTAVVPDGYPVKYKQFFRCYRRSCRRRRANNDIILQRSTPNDKHLNPRGYYVTLPRRYSGGNMIRCDDRDFTCFRQNC